MHCNKIDSVTDDTSKEVSKIAANNAINNRVSSKKYNNKHSYAEEEKKILVKKNEAFYESSIFCKKNYFK